jgi:hypothetical protein
LVGMELRMRPLDGDGRAVGERGTGGRRSEVGLWRYGVDVRPGDGGRCGRHTRGEASETKMIVVCCLFVLPRVLSLLLRQALEC